MSISIPEETRKKLEDMAKKEMRSISNMIAYLVENYGKIRKELNKR